MSVIDYGDNSIKCLSVTEQMRRRPSMWGFNVASIEGLLIQIKEIVDNAADEAIDKNRRYPVEVTFFVSKDRKTYQCLVRDRGRGIPVGRITDVFIGGFSSGKYEGAYGGASTGTNGIGSKAVSVFSKLFLAFTKRPDGFGYGRIEKGTEKDKYIQRKPIDKDMTSNGSMVLFQPDPEMFACLENMFGDPPDKMDQNGYQIFLDRVIYYPLFHTNIDFTVRYVDGLLKPSDLNKDPIELWKFFADPNNFKHKVVYQSDATTTPRSYVSNKYRLKQPMWELGHLKKDSDGTADDPLGLDIDVFIDERSAKGECGYIAAVNYTPIFHPESSHIAVLQEVLKNYIVKLIEDDGARAFFKEKYRIPLSGSITATWLGAEFIGQDKTRFENRQFSSLYSHTLKKMINQIVEQSGDGIWDKLYEIIKEHFEAEYAKFSRSVYKSSRSMKGIGYGLNRDGSYAGCKSSDPRLIELFIAEGDSAAGNIKTGRDAETQALLKLGGKPINAIRNDGKKLDKNLIYQDMIMLLGVNPADKNLDNMKFSRILIVTDADADGYHIVVLLFSIFYQINPLILTEGRVCIVCPPLYAAKFKRETVYLRDEHALHEAHLKMYNSIFKIEASVNDGPLIETNKNQDLFRDICLAAEKIADVVLHHAKLLNIDPHVLDQMVHCVDYIGEDNVNTKKIKEILHIDDCTWDRENNSIILVNDVEIPIPLANLQKTIKEVILPIYMQFHWDKIKLFLTTKKSTGYQREPCSFASLGQCFRVITNNEKGLFTYSRFKGLGEMSKEAIRFTCIDKDTRCFYTIRGMGDIEQFFSLLKVDTEARKRLIDNDIIAEE